MKKVRFELNEKTDLTADEIRAAKTAYGKVYKLSVKSDDDDSIEAQCFIHRPNRQILDLADASSKTKNSKFNETILKNCWLAGDKSIVENDEHFYAVSKQLNSIVKFKDAELVEL
jgi:hypothetical protein